MMERKLWFKIFALLLLALSALAHDNETSSLSPVAPVSTAGPGPTLALDTTTTTTAGPESGSSLGESGQVSEPNNNTQTSPSGSGLNSKTEGESVTLTAPATSNGTTPSNTPETPDTNGNTTEHAPTPAAPENQIPTTQSQPTTAATAPGPTNKTDTSPVPPPTSPPHLENTNATQDAENVTLITKPTPSTSASVAAATPTVPAASTTTTIAPSTITTTTSLVQGSTQAPAGENKPTTTTHSEVPGDAVSHKTITPSQLNVGEDTTVVQEGATLDPLLAGLVSAFIIAAVIITLLLFLKLRRRDGRPEFRRLQDLPMDDMMEDAPLSMYSY